MTALDPTGLLPDSTTLESLYDEGRLTTRAWNRIQDWNASDASASTALRLVTVRDVRELGTRLRLYISDGVAVRNILAAIRTDWREPHTPESKLSALVAAAEPVESQRDELERLRAEYAVARQQLDEALAKLEHVREELRVTSVVARAMERARDSAELRATVAEAKLAALSAMAATVYERLQHRVGYSASLAELRHLLDQQAGDGGGR